MESEVACCEDARQEHIIGGGRGGKRKCGYDGTIVSPARRDREKRNRNWYKGRKGVEQFRKCKGVETHQLGGSVRSDIELSRWGGGLQWVREDKRGMGKTQTDRRGVPNMGGWHQAIWGERHSPRWPLKE